MKKNLCLKAIIILFPFYLHSQTTYECEVQYTPPSTTNATFRSATANCEFLNLTTDEYNQIPIITIPVVFHFIPDTTGDNFICNPPTWSTLDAEWMANELIDAANEDVFDGPAQNNLGGGIVPDTRIRLELANITTNTQCAGIWIYNNSNANPTTNYSAGVIDIVCEDDNEIGSFIIGGSTGGPNSGWIRNRNLLHYVQSGNASTWLHGRNIAHEVGHILNLPHSFSCHNDCYDMDNIAQCNSAPYGDCDSE